MALTTLISFGIVGAQGKSKRVPVYIVATANDTEIQAAIDAIAPAMDAAIDGQITDVLVTKAFTLPGGLKSSANDPSHAREGALLSFDAAGTNYTYSVYVPTWEEAGFADDTVLSSGSYAALEAALIASYGAGSRALTDPYGNDLTAFLQGKRTFRK
jgi:hypothetical protein